MKKSIVIVLMLSVCGTLFAERPASLNRYDLNRPFGWAVYNSTAGAYSLTGGGSASPVVLKSTGADMTATLQSALNSNKVVVLDGSQGDFLVSTGVYLNSSASHDKTIVGINGATIRQINSVTSEMRKYLDSRFASKKETATSGYVKSRNISIPETSQWYVSEGDELYVRGYMIDYYYEVLGVRDEETLLAEDWKKWGCLRVNSKDGTGCNIIIRNISFIGPGSLDLSGQDGFCLLGCHNVWIDHCHFQDGQDGNLDLVKSDTRNTTNVTVSWCTFSYGDRSYNHRFNTLISVDDAEKVFITLANCHWAGGIYYRTPLGSGRVHIVNCLYDAPGPGGRIQNQAGLADVPFYLDHNYFCAGLNGSSPRTYTMESNKGKQYYYYSDGNYGANGEGNFSNSGIGNTGYNGAKIPYVVDYIPAKLLPTVITGPNGAGPTLTDPLVID